MSFIRRIEIVDGVEVERKIEGPKGLNKAGKLVSPLGYLGPSGKTYVNPAWAAGARRGGAQGADGQGNEFVPDQRWIYDYDEAGRLEEDEPDRYVRAEG
jgi:hypothetical protein